MTAPIASASSFWQPLAERQAELHRASLQPPQPLDIEQKWHPMTPDYSRGTMTMVSDENLRIEVELGPLLVNHRFRGASPPLQVSVWA
jgi:hypothetical protein